MIKIHKTSLPEVLKIERDQLFKDHRGISGDAIYKKEEYLKAGIKIEFLEQYLSSSRKNVLRGLHGDSKTWKLISCLYGEFCLIVLNYDKTSPHFGKWESFTLSPENRLQILVPPLHANGHLVLSDWAIFHYNQSEYYVDASSQFTVMWNDPQFNVVWPIKEEPILSDRDKGVKKIRK